MLEHPTTVLLEKFFVGVLGVFQRYHDIDSPTHKDLDVEKPGFCPLIWRCKVSRFCLLHFPFCLGSSGSKRLPSWVIF